MKDDFAPKGAEGRAIEVKSAVELLVCGESGVDSRCSQKIQCHYCLLQQFIPQHEGKVGVSTTKDRNKMILEGSDCSLGRISAVGVSWSQLKIDFLFLHEIFELSTCLVVQSLQFGAEASLGDWPFIYGQRERALSQWSDDPLD